ncbi:phage tail assembly chaperone [Methylomagnum ishizawai]|uniref:phage tail assembly chaperone n=1 Tax=Methylomagnum ishizawai TaxID=1760988 RepID=UPI001C338727|nr:phage tail assembly chaperone [Methylomagnum ishizawai]BBL75575.1 hypothetical protein MishRS11D_26730 [Methylomagnum ishizawai]
MPFILDTKTGNSFKYPVNIPHINGEGLPEKIGFKMVFRRFSRSSYLALQDDLDGRDIQGGLLRDVDYVLRVADGWEGIAGPDAAELPFTAENIKTLLDHYPAAAGAIVDAFHDAVLRGGVARGN